MIELELKKSIEEVRCESSWDSRKQWVTQHLHESQRILKSCEREVLVYAIVYILPGGNAMYLSTLKKVIR